MKQTILFAEHKARGAKMAPFGGWQMPISYTSVLDEHACVRKSCGIFDVSHMGEIFVEGKDALAFIQYVMINDASRLEPGQGQYTAMCNEHGGIVDDLIIYRLEEQKFLICANAANIEKDFEWLNKHSPDFSATIRNDSDSFAQIAVQGPLAGKAMQELVAPQDIATLNNLSYMQIAPLSLRIGCSALVARTGYTGERGYEVYLSNEFAPQLWRALLDDGSNLGTQPVGLAARDTLRLEACYLLYGNDIDDTVTPLEAGIGWATKLAKENFVGKSALTQQKEQGPKRKLVAFTMTDKAIPRSGMDVYLGESRVGKVTSGSVLPTVGGAGGLALLDIQASTLDTKLDIDVRGKRRLATIVKKPIYSAKVKS